MHLAVQHLFFIHTIVFSKSYPFSPFLSNTEICIPARKCAIEAHHASARGKISLVSKNVNILITSVGSGYSQSNCQSWVFTNILCISLSLKQRRWKTLEASENSLDQSSCMWHLIIILVWWTFIITNMKNPLLLCERHGRNPLTHSVLTLYSHLGSSPQMERHEPIIRGQSGPALSCHVCAWMEFW